MESKYMITVDTLLGKEKGILVFDNSNEVLNGYIQYKGKKYEFTNGILIDRKFEFSSSIKTLFININFRVIGEICENKLKAEILTKYGTFYASGVKNN